MVSFAMRAGERPGEWTGNYSPCDRHTEVLKRGHMDLGVRFSASNPATNAEFSRAMNFWATILDMDWHEEDSRNCAIQIVDGRPGLFRPAEAARAQFPDGSVFQGWIAFNPRASLPASDLFRTAVHELGHVLGLPHSTNASSLMYFLRVDGPVWLDQADLAVLASRHKLRGVAAPAILPAVAFQAPGHGRLAQGRKTDRFPGPTKINDTWRPEPNHTFGSWFCRWWHP